MIFEAKRQFSNPIRREGVETSRSSGRRTGMDWALKRQVPSNRNSSFAETFVLVDAGALEAHLESMGI